MNGNEYWNLLLVSNIVVFKAYFYFGTLKSYNVGLVFSNTRNCSTLAKRDTWITIPQFLLKVHLH